jgi:hypothetical protein
VTWHFFGGWCQTTVVKTGATVSLCDGRWTEVLDCDYDEQYCALAGYYRITGDSVMIRHKDIVRRNGQWKDTVYCDEPEGLMYDFAAARGDTLQCRVAYAGNADTETWNVTKFRNAYGADSVDVLEMNFRPYTNFPQVIWSMNWVESVGSSIHPFYSLTCMGDHCEIEQQTTRAWRNDTLIYVHTTFLFSFPCTGWVSNDPLSELKVSVFPNPAQDVVELSLEGLQGPSMAAGLYDIFGKKVRHLSLEQGINRITLDISFSFLPSF